VHYFLRFANFLIEHQKVLPIQSVLPAFLLPKNHLNSGHKESDLINLTGSLRNTFFTFGNH